jgi:PAS domain S-box-containing protein
MKSSGDHPIIGSSACPCEVTQKITTYLESKTEEFSRGWLNLTTDGIWDWNLETNEVYFSPRFKKLLGYEDAELPNRAETWQQLIHPDDLMLALLAFKQHTEEGKPFSFPVRYKHKDGSTIWVLCRGVALKNEVGKFSRLVGTHSDITALKRAEEALAERVQLAELGAEIGAALNRPGTLPELLQRCVEVFVRRLGVAFARIWTLSKTGEVLELQASAGLYTHRNGLHSRVPVGKLKIGLIAEERKPQITNAVIGDPHVGDQEWARREGMVAFAGHPLIYRDRVVGVLAMFSRQPFSPVTFAALSTVADSIAYAIAHLEAVEAVRISEERFDLAIQGTDEGIWDWNVLTNECYYSPRLKALLGCQEHELQNHFNEFETRLHLEDHDRVLQVVRQHLEQRSPYRVDYRLRTQSGEYRWFHARGQALWDATGRAVRMVGSIRDITWRKLNEQRLAAIHEVTQILAETTKWTDAMPRVLRSLCENLDWAVGEYWVWDQQADVLRLAALCHQPMVSAPHFEAVSRDRVFSRGVGLPGRTWVSKQPEWIRDVTQDVNFPRAAAAAQDSLHGAVAFPISIGTEFHGVMEFFRTSALTPDPELEKLLGDVVLHMSRSLWINKERHRAEEANRYLAALVESCDDAIIGKDVNGVVKSWNNGAQKVFGYSAEEMVGQQITRLFPPDRLREETEILERLRRGERVDHFETVRVRKDGRQIEVSVTISPILDSEGRVVGASKIARDISERKRAVQM